MNLPALSLQNPERQGRGTRKTQEKNKNEAPAEIVNDGAPRWNGAERNRRKDRPSTG